MCKLHAPLAENSLISETRVPATLTVTLPLLTNKAARRRALSQQARCQLAISPTQKRQVSSLFFVCPVSCYVSVNLSDSSDPHQCIF